MSRPAGTAHARSRSKALTAAAAMSQAEDVGQDFGDGLVQLDGDVVAYSTPL